MFSRISRYLKQLPRKRIAIGSASLLVLLVVVSITGAQFGEHLEDERIIRIKEVELINVGTASTDKNTVSLLGEVRSEREATLQTEKAGKVTGVYRTVGSFVLAGTILAEIENGAERAAVLQAQGSVDQAEAALAKVSGGSREEQLAILETNVEQAEANLENSYTSAKNTLFSVYATIDDAVVRRSDPMFTNPSATLPQFRVLTTRSALETQLENDRIVLQSILARQSEIKSALTTETIETELARTVEDTRFVKSFLDTLISALNSSVATEEVSATDIAGYKVDAATARTNILNTLTTITAAQESIVNRKAALSIARENLEQGVIGGQSEDVRSAEAVLKQAKGALASAFSNLERTLIRTPISGTISTLSLQTGDFVSAFESAAIVSSGSGFTIETFVTSNDRQYIRVGSAVRIDNTYDGVVTSIAPGIDPHTKKIRVQVGVTDTNTNLVRGSSVSLTIEREQAIDTNSEEIRIPISALKVEPNRIIVFSVNTKNRLVAHEVTEGPILGNKIVILEGISVDLDIVSDARGLQEGEEVIVR